MTQPRSKSKQPRRRAHRDSTPSRSTTSDRDLNGTAIIPVVEEHVHVGKTRKTAYTRVRIVPQERVEAVDVPLIHENVEVTRVPVNRVVDAPIPVRQEGDVMIVPVFEETLVIEKKLVLREEIHIRRRQTTRRETRKVRVRKEAAEIIPSGQPS